MSDHPQNGPNRGKCISFGRCHVKFSDFFKRTTVYHDSNNHNHHHHDSHEKLYIPTEIACWVFSLSFSFHRRVCVCISA